MTDVAVSETQRHHVFAMLGDDGVDWLRRLPEIVDWCAREWSLTVGPPFPGVWFNYVAEAWLADGTPAVLKVCFLHGEFYSEAEALRLYAGNGMVRLLRSDLSSGVLLLERLVPGTSLETLSTEDDRAATAIAASAMRRLATPFLPITPSPPSPAGGWASNAIGRHFHPADRSPRPPSTARNGFSTTWRRARGRPWCCTAISITATSWPPSASHGW